MVATPWGQSESLRGRRLRPGPGAPREDVLATSASGCSGRFSSRTFYDLFADKQACFLATLEAIIEAAVAYAAQGAGEMVGDPRPDGVNLPESAHTEGARWEERARWGFDAFAEIVVAQPAATRLAMVESYAAGPKAMVPPENAVAGFEWLTQQMLEQPPERAEMPAKWSPPTSAPRRSPAPVCGAAPRQSCRS